MDSISQLREETKNDLRKKVQEATINMKKMEEGLTKFGMKVENVFKAITEKGTKMKAMVDKCVVAMIASVKDQSKKERDNLKQLSADTEMDLKTGSDLDKKIYEINKTRNDGKLLQSLKKLTDDISKVTIKPIPKFPNIQYTVKPVNDNDITQLFGIFKIG